MKANHQALAKCVQKCRSAGRCKSCSHGIGYYISSWGNSIILLLNLQVQKGPSSHVRFLGPIAPVVYGRRDAHHQRGEAVSAQIVVLFAGVLALKDLHQHEIELHALQTHPGEGSQEEEMQKASNDGTGDLREASREKRQKGNRDGDRGRAETQPGENVWRFSSGNKSCGEMERIRVSSQRSLVKFLIFFILKLEYEKVLKIIVQIQYYIYSTTGWMSADTHLSITRENEKWERSRGIPSCRSR